VKVNSCMKKKYIWCIAIHKVLVLTRYVSRLVCTRDDCQFPGVTVLYCGGDTRNTDVGFLSSCSFPGLICIPYTYFPSSPSSAISYHVYNVISFLSCFSYLPSFSLSFEQAGVAVTL
jgi:hypothetical protein